MVDCTSLRGADKCRTSVKTGEFPSQRTLFPPPTPPDYTRAFGVGQTFEESGVLAGVETSGSALPGQGPSKMRRTRFRISCAVNSGMALIGRDRLRISFAKATCSRLTSGTGEL